MVRLAATQAQVQTRAVPITPLIRLSIPLNVFLPNSTT